MDPPSYPLPPTSRHSLHEVFITDEERTGLLSSEPEDRDTELVQPISSNDPSTISSRHVPTRISSTAVAIVFLGAIFGPSLLVSISRRQVVCDTFDHQQLRTNGTHLYKKTSIIVSIDGLRYAS